MRAPVKIVLVVVLIALVGGIVSQVAFCQREPAWRGKRLSRWLTDYAKGSPAEWQEAIEAVHQIGTNAIPALLSMLREKDPALELKLMDLLQRHHLVRARYTPRGVRRNCLGQVGFALLGDQAKSAVPALIEIADQNISVESQGHAVLSLGSIGPQAKEAVPALLRCATNADEKLRLEAGVSLRIIAPESLIADTNRVGQPGGPANRSQPVHPETNRTSAAAGSGR